jgi:hypothetical protein
VSIKHACDYATDIYNAKAPKFADFEAGQARQAVRAKAVERRCPATAPAMREHCASFICEANAGAANGNVPF